MAAFDMVGTNVSEEISDSIFRLSVTVNPNLQPLYTSLIAYSSLKTCLLFITMAKQL
jgi:hypothetical protein